MDNDVDEEEKEEEKEQEEAGGAWLVDDEWEFCLSYCSELLEFDL